MKAFRSVSTAILQPSIRSPTFTCRAAYLANASIRSTNHERQRRTFVSNPFTQNQTLTAHRTLRYPASVIYEIVSDVASYKTFLPYCQDSIVTKYSEPAPDGKKYPEEAKLVVGFNDSISEEFTSRVYCVPERIVEAVSGNQVSTLEGSEEIGHHSARPPVDQDPSRKDTVMASLLTRWTLRPYPYKPPPVAATHPDGVHKNHEETNPIPGQEKTEVNLTIEFQFSNPLYAAVSSAAAAKVAEMMIEAFENRVKAVLEGPGSVAGVKKSIGGSEGLFKGKMK
ncbi:hypothetical protein DOTSEDRAFT_75040 [Lecanosticta acicola]|uniref:Coenzyme Q-binding protein COQ10 START domain-containing protein n=1 Tax=Lecanosticta acicola TaxID=111012 RepID=A0AAI8YZ05_9PEZI|nr:hypothetical protein DOTSEDRAFT_75040 [Lecanosticta acicola]